MSKLKVNDIKSASADIKVNDITPSGAESFINDLSDSELKIAGGLSLAHCCGCGDSQIA